MNFERNILLMIKRKLPELVNTSVILIKQLYL